MDEIRNREADALLAHASFVKGVARGILGRDSRVDDAVQETWLAAIRKRPDRDGGVRGWLAGAVRNVSLSFRRGDAARKRREDSSRPPARLPTPAEIAAREEERSRVLRAVLDLDEPYRTAVLYRYYEDLPPREIGRATGVPTETARTRVKRGLERLRKKLLAEHGGDGRALCAALLPLTGLRHGTIAASATAGTAVTGVAIMSAKTKLAAVGIVALLLVGGVGLQQFGGDDAPPPPDAPDGMATGTTAHVDPPPLEPGKHVVAETGDSAGRAESAGGSVDPAGRTGGSGGPGSATATEVARGAQTERAGEVRGNVVSDEVGLPLEGARIVLRYDILESGGRWPKGGDRPLEFVTDATGDFRYEGVPPGVYRIRIEHPDYAPRTLTGVRVGDGKGLEGLSVRMIGDLRRLGTVEGTVLDAFGGPVVAARVVVHSSQSGVSSEAVTGELGAYRVERMLPGFYAVSLTKEPAEGEKAKLWQRTLSVRVVAGQTVRVDFEGSGALSGVVLDPEDKPIKAAMVLLMPVHRSERAADRRTRTAEDGTFRIENAGIGLHRVTVGGTSAGWFSVEAATVDLGGSDQELRIRLEGGEISGKLLLEDGKAPISRGLHPSIMLFPAEWKGEPKDYREAARAQPDRTGSFRLIGLAEGKYRMRIFQTGYSCPERDVTVGWGERVKGVDLVLRRLVLGTLVVTVVDSEGNPVEGAVLNYWAKGRSGRGVRPSRPEPGRYVSHTVEVGSWTLSVIRPGSKTSRVPIVVNEGKTTSVRVTMEAK